METPFYGVSHLTAELKRRGYRVNHKRVRRLQKSLNLRTVYPCPHFNTSEPHREHENSRIFYTNAFRQGFDVAHGSLCHRAPENTPPVGTPKYITLRYE